MQQHHIRHGMHCRASAVMLAMALSVLLHGASLAAEEGHGAPAAKQQHDASAAARPAGKRKPLISRLPPDVRRDDQKYCYQIADDARDARYARQKQKLQQMQRKLEGLLRQLEKKSADYRRWVERREAITRRMTRAMLDVYEKMEPEAAAAQIAQMQYAVAVAILTGLKPQKASAILTEMNPKDAGRLVDVIVGAVAESARPARQETN